MSREISKPPMYSIIILLEELREDFERHVDTIVQIFERRNAGCEILIISNGAENLLNKIMPGFDYKYQIRSRTNWAGVIENLRSAGALCADPGQ